MLLLTAANDAFDVIYAGFAHAGEIQLAKRLD